MCFIQDLDRVYNVWNVQTGIRIQKNCIKILKQTKKKSEGKQN